MIPVPFSSPHVTQTAYVPWLGAILTGECSKRMEMEGPAMIIDPDKPGRIPSRGVRSMSGTRKKLLWVLVSWCPFWSWWKAIMGVPLRSFTPAHSGAFCQGRCPIHFCDPIFSQRGCSRFFIFPADVRCSNSWAINCFNQSQCKPTVAYFPKHHWTLLYVRSG